MAHQPDNGPTCHACAHNHSCINRCLRATQQTTHYFTKIRTFVNTAGSPIPNTKESDDLHVVEVRPCEVPHATLPLLVGHTTQEGAPPIRKAIAWTTAIEIHWHASATSVFYLTYAAFQTNGFKRHAEAHIETDAFASSTELASGLVQPTNPHELKKQGGK